MNLDCLSASAVPAKPPWAACAASNGGQTQEKPSQRRPTPAQGPAAGAGAFISPFSVGQAMGMLLNGADPTGDSARQLLEAVFGQATGGNGNASQVNSQMAALAAQLLAVRLLRPWPDLALTGAYPAVRVGPCKPHEGVNA